jgi:hypothetical protein
MLVTAETVLRVWYPVPTRYYCGRRTSSRLRAVRRGDPGVAARGRFRTNRLGLRSDQPFADARRVV